MEPTRYYPPVPKYKRLAGTIQARLNCIQNNNREWEENHEETINNIIKSLPHGSGIDGVTKIDLDKVRRYVSCLYPEAPDDFSTFLSTAQKAVSESVAIFPGHHSI